MKSINVYNALLAYKASKEAKFADDKDVLTFDIDGNSIKLPFGMDTRWKRRLMIQKF